MCVSGVSIHAWPDIHLKGNLTQRIRQDISMTEIGDPEILDRQTHKRTFKDYFEGYCCDCNKTMTNVMQRSSISRL